MDYCGVPDDADEDGIPNYLDNCPGVYNDDQADADQDGMGDACDACPASPENDADDDGLCGDVDNCPYDHNPGQADGDGDGAGDACDNCLAAPNPDQADTDSIGLGMLSFWTLDEGSGTTAADSAGGSPGTIAGAAWTGGRVDGALRFDGVDDHVTVEGSSFLENITEEGDYTFEAWFYPLSVPPNVDPDYIDMAYGIVTKPGWHTGLDYSHTKRIQATVWNTENQGFGVGSVTYEPEQWIHAVMTVDSVSGVLALYTNGQLQGTAAFHGIPRDYGTNPLMIGMGGTPSWSTHRFPAHGVIDEVAVYDRALSAEEIALHYQSGLAGARYPAEDGAGDACDNCPDHHNPGQADADADGAGDACEPDTDYDGVIDDHDNCLETPNPPRLITKNATMPQFNAYMACAPSGDKIY
ncbi:MAG: LamG domain-containing protein [Elusimicrobiota bacterium]